MRAGEDERVVEAQHDGIVVDLADVEQASSGIARRRAAGTPRRAAPTAVTISLMLTDRSVSTSASSHAPSGVVLERDVDARDQLVDALRCWSRLQSPTRGCGHATRTAPRRRRRDWRSRTRAASTRRRRRARPGSGTRPGTCASACRACACASSARRRACARGKVAMWHGSSVPKAGRVHLEHRC